MITRNIRAVQSEISDFGFEMQDSSNFKISSRTLNGLDFPIRCGDISARDVSDRLGAAIAHYELEFTLKNLENAIHTVLAERTQSP